MVNVTSPPSFSPPHTDSSGTNEQLKFLISPESQVVAAGDNVTFYCIAEGNNTHLTYNWTRDGRPIRDKMSFGPSVLFLARVTVGHSGNYGCSATASGGSKSITGTASLRVLGRYSCHSG